MLTSLPASVLIAGAMEKPPLVIYYDGHNSCYRESLACQHKRMLWKTPFAIPIAMKSTWGRAKTSVMDL